MSTARKVLVAGTIGALLVAGLVLSPASARPDPEPRLTVAPGFVGVPAGVSVDNPAVTPRTPVAAAALAHVERYPTLGVDADQLVAGSVMHTVAGTDVVRLVQEVDGVPVMGGGVIVSIGADRELSSALARVTDATGVSAPVVSEDRASATARAVTARASGARPGSLTVTRNGRQLLDPVVAGLSADVGTHTVWSFDVGGVTGVRRTVLVDVRTGAVVLNHDAIAYHNRVVCDADSAVVNADCDHDFARTETSGPSTVSDVNEAFDFSGATADVYDDVAGIDLTEMIGIEVDGTKAIASSVRVCTSTECPYVNAYWSGTGMVYGDGMTGADDVVGHEITHGYIQHTSNLYYWRQSGAINESMADVIGEIVDHRNPSSGDAPDDWRSGEDLWFGADRDLADPTWSSGGGGQYARPQPDRMTSSYYVGHNDGDSAGVHTNSGVGNKTAYLISQGGTFNGQTINGIDGADQSLTKTATLYLQAIPMLASGSDYADLALVLDQACQQLIGGAALITKADCAEVHKAGLATELRTTPPAAPLPADAPRTCPSGRSLRVLLDGNGPAQFTASGGWTWDQLPNASSGSDSWWSPSTTSSSVQALEAAAITLPAGQPSYLWFQHFWVLDYDDKGFYDGAKVEIDDVDTADLPWVNGPDKQISAGWDNPQGGTFAFVGDSLGWLSSRLDLSSYAGALITPAWVQYDDPVIGFQGWFVDDIALYTCDLLVSNTAKPKVSGTPKVGRTLTAKPGTWAPADVALSYTWLRNGKAVKGATKPTYKPVTADQGKKLSVRVTGTRPHVPPVVVASAAVGPVKK